jgi:crossover junction endodeoxyribonuclease RuvC
VKVLGIDPGMAACGYAIVDAQGGWLTAVEHGWWRTSAREEPALRLKLIHDSVVELIARHEPDSASLEESYVGADARNALFVGQARGALLVACASSELHCTEYSPSTVKQAVCGYGRADKGQVQRMVTTILRLDEPPKSDHASDALAVAICHALASPLAAALAAGAAR